MRQRKKLPREFKQRLEMTPARARVAGSLERLGLNTVCRSARCPNANRCFSEGTATFLILGPVCSRSCRFCAVPKGRPAPVDAGEPAAVATAVSELNLAYSVITSVTRDDLPDGGAGHFAETARAVLSASPGTKVEMLVPDFRGEAGPLETVLSAGPAVFNHNVETVPRLYPRVRPEADYGRSLRVLAAARKAGVPVKSGLMVGMGEGLDEVKQLLEDLAIAGCGLVTVGQYLAPSPGHHPVDRFWEESEFREVESYGRERLGMLVAAGPLVRSSLGAHILYNDSYKTKTPGTAT